MRALPLAESRGYTQQELYTLAEMGYRYLRCGGTRLAAVIFEGLAAIDPREPYFALAMGLVSDHLGDRRAAAQWYATAAQLDPSDARPEINLAELALEAGDLRRAANLLQRGLEKSRRSSDEALEKKAAALLQHLGA